jgi:two-component system sensor histidine kinase/response regulator
MPTVLIIDDDTAIRVLLRAILRREGFEVFEAREGEEALHVLSTRRFDVILLDLMMPVMSGHQVLDQLALTQPKNRNVIVLTAASERHLRGINRTVVRSVLRKPFNLHELVDEVRAALRKRLLLVEDDEACAYLVSRNLTEAGYDVTHAPDGQTALEMLDASSFDALVVDLKLPLVDGYEVIEHAASQPFAPPVVVLSVNAGPEKPLARVDAYLRKPEGIDTVAGTLREFAN